MCVKAALCIGFGRKQLVGDSRGYVKMSTGSRECGSAIIMGLFAREIACRED